MSKHEQMIERPDGSFIPYDKLKVEEQIEHDFVVEFCRMAEEKAIDLAVFKHDAIAQMVARRQMLLTDFGVKKGGKEGNLTLRSACGRYMVRMSVAKSVSFGPQLEAAKALIDEIVEEELAKGASEFIAEIVHRVFKPNATGRIDTQGILNLRQVKCAHPSWENAMKAVEDSLQTDGSATYINFFKVDPTVNPKHKGEDRISLNIAEL